MGNQKKTVMHAKGNIYVIILLSALIWIGVLHSTPWKLQLSHPSIEGAANTESMQPTTMLLSQLGKIKKEQTTSALSDGPQKRRHVLILLGTRPEAVKLAPVILELRRRPEQFHCTVVSTGQHAAMLTQVLEAFNLGDDAVDLSLDLMIHNQTLGDLTSRVMERMDQTLMHLAPDIVLVQGDTTTAFIGALAAFYHKIPIGHVEAGLRTRDLYSPFPEEANRQSIGVLASLHFAATNIAARNLIEEGKDPTTVFVTGNPVVDALQLYLRPFTTYGSGKEVAIPPTNGTKKERGISNSAEIIADAMSSRCSDTEGNLITCRLILLTAHRRENHGQPLQNIINAVSRILAAYPDILVVYPVHLNPNVHKAIQSSVPADVYARLEEQDKVIGSKPNARKDRNKNIGESLPPASHKFDRFMLLPPMDYPDLVRVMSMSDFIMTDSGGIQEEGAVLGKPILILRDTTERPEGVLAGVASLVGTDENAIVAKMTELLDRRDAENRLASVTGKTLYGDGHAAKRITDLIEWYLEDQRFASGSPSMVPLVRPPVPHYERNDAAATKPYDIVVVLTVWKRDTLEAYLQLLSEQTLLQLNPDFRTNVIVFQNGEHLNVSSTLHKWKNTDLWHKATVDITYVHSPMATGYYGRFLAPLLSDVRPDGYFVVCDDDVIFGTKYLENMARVVDAGSLAVRVGRFLGQVTQGGEGYTEHMGVSVNGWQIGIQISNAEDVEYDFGGQVWMGRFAWIKAVWHHPPPVILTSEDFWISAVLKAYHGVSTRRPRCPSNDMEECACSMHTANDHKAVEVGSVVGGEFEVRERAMGTIVKAYGYQPLGEKYIAIEATRYVFYSEPEGPFDTRATRFQECLYWT